MRAKFTAALGLAGLVSLSACVDLEEEIVTGVTSAYYETAAGLEDAVKAAYSGLGDQYAQERSMTMQEMGTDTWIKGSDGSHKFWNDYDPQLNPVASFTREHWDLTYRAINTANAVVERAPKVPVSGPFTEARRTLRIAEARFLRGLYYFSLVRHYGDVPLTLKETTGVVTEAKRAPEADVYKAIIDDLAFAEANLPASQGEYGRATRGAAQHLLGLVYLTRSYESFAQAGDADRAADLFRKVIGSGQYRLLPSYADLFKLENERNSEVIFSAQFTSDPLTTGTGNSWHLYFLMEYDRELGMTRDIQYGRPFKRLRPTEYLLGVHDRSRDTRYEAGFQHVWLVNKADPSKGLALGDTAIYMPAVKSSALPAVYKNKKYTVFTEPENFEKPQARPVAGAANVKSEYDYRYYPTLTKHLDPTRASINETRGQRDLFVMRLADTHLLLGEALLRAGKPQEAVAHLNL
ncbi:MAG: RagB/SusD family nutrient uptake outer membrane protein, partial [Gemmatimonadota bacterium]|nr:RagB/SusD family nutrient uptake outer membrane protein [Gemmatimonadota bacterium]